MAWRFKASKYKNAAPIVPKPEACARDLCVGSYQTFGNNICASAAFMAFNWEHVGSSVAVLQLDDSGRKSKTMPLLHAHTDTVTDMEFSPFHDGLLLTGSQDSLVKVWHIPPEGLKESLSNAECTLSQKQRRVENVGFHPTADGLVHVASGHQFALWDLTTQQEAFATYDHTDSIQSTSWKKDGRLVATQCKDKKLRVIDPRASAAIVNSTPSHQNIKDSRVVWLGEKDWILTSGFDSARLRQVMIRDVRNLSTPVKTLELDCSTGVLMPLYDADTGMLFLAGKGDTTILYMEVLERDPFLVEGLRHSGEQTKGACLVPKRALRVMEGEVNRVLQLASSTVVPIMYQVPRKSYRQYHADLYPDTSGRVTYLSASAWLSNHDLTVPTISLDPQANNSVQPRLGPKPFSASQGSEEFSFDKVFSVPAVPGRTPLQGKIQSASSPVAAAEAPSMKNGSGGSSQSEDKCSPVSDADIPTAKDATYTNGRTDRNNEEEANSPDITHKPKTPGTTERRKMFEATDGASIADRRKAYESRSCSVATESETPPSPAPLRRRDSLKSRKSPERDDKRASVPNANMKRTSTVFGRVSKFRHLKGTTAHKSTHIENIKNISRQVSGECNGFYANGVRCALPVGGCGGGRVAILELPIGATPAATAPQPHPSSHHPRALLHPAPLQDWAWDPFRDDRLLVACDDGAIREWIIPEGGLKESTNTPARCFAAHPDKIYIIRFHPSASDILASAAHDLTIKIWDLTDEPKAVIVLTGHTEQIFSMEWSSCGEYLATVCKDSLIRIYKPRSSTEPLRSGKGPIGGRGARIVWALNGTHLVVTGFDKVSERQIMLFKTDDLSSCVCFVGLDVSPAILQIHIDHDSGTLFLTGRGDSTIYCYEVTCEPPYLCALSHHRCSSLHQGISFLQKNLVAVEKVEFARALRLTNGNIEPLSFTVPRIKSELFQDDLFPPTLQTWVPSLSGAEWAAGVSVSPRTVSLCPAGMPALSSHSTPPQQRQTPMKPEAAVKSGQPLDHKQLQSNIIKSMGSRVEMNLKLEQDQVLGDGADWE